MQSFPKNQSQRLKMHTHPTRNRKKSTQTNRPTHTRSATLIHWNDVLTFVCMVRKKFLPSSTNEIQQKKLFLAKLSWIIQKIKLTDFSQFQSKSIQNFHCKCCDCFFFAFSLYWFYSNTVILDENFNFSFNIFYTFFFFHPKPRYLRSKKNRYKTC